MFSVRARAAALLVLLCLPWAGAYAMSVEEAEAGLGSSNAEVRGQAARFLSENKAPRAVPALMKAVRTEKKGNVRASMLRALGRAGDARAAALLQEVAANGSESMEARGLALTNLYHVGNPDSWKFLEKLALDSSQPAALRGHALAFAAIREGEGSMEMLRKALRDPDAGVRAQAVAALRQISGPEAEGMIRAALNDDDAVVRQVAQSILDRRKLLRQKERKGAK